MKKICKDPKCPANHPCIKNYNASTSTTTLINNKKKKKELKKQKKLKKKPNNLNKKCQTPKLPRESTTSLSICRINTCNSIAKPKIMCQCPKRKIPKESKAKKIIDKVTPNSRCMKIKDQPISCICVKKSSSEDLKKLCKCSSTCTFLSKYNDCCCIREKIKKKKKKNDNSIDYCYSNKEMPFKGTLCTKYREQSPKKNIFVKGFSKLRNKLQKLKTRKKRKREYAEHRCCGNSFRTRNQIMEKRKVKFC